MSDSIRNDAAPAIYACIAAVICCHLWAGSRFANSVAATLMAFSLLSGLSMATGNDDMTEHERTEIKNPSVKFALPPPFTVDQFLKNLTMLLSEHSGYVTYQTFESMFHLNDNSKQHTGPGSLYEAGIDWYFRTLIYQGDTFYSGIPTTQNHSLYSDFEIRIPVDAFGDWKQGQCVRAGDAKRALLGAGWNLKKKKVWNQYDRDRMHDEFEFGRASLAMKHYVHYIGRFDEDDDATCVTELTVRGIPQ